MKLSYYEILCVRYDASSTEITKAYRKRALKTHPDMNNAINANRLMIELIEAYKELGNSVKRKKYDETLWTDDVTRINDNHLLNNAAELAFDRLEKELGKKVIIDYWAQGEGVKTIEDQLIEVRRFSHLGLGTLIMPFIGLQRVITKIRDAKTNDTLYFNPHFSFMNDSPNPLTNATNVKRKLWGTTIAQRDYDEMAEWDRQARERRSQINAIMREKKDMLIAEGLKHVKLELKSDWCKWVDVNMNDGYSAALVEATVRIMSDVENGCGFDRVDEISEEMQLSGNLMEGAAGAVAHFYVNGDSFKNSFDSMFDKENLEATKKIKK